MARWSRRFSLPLVHLALTALALWVVPLAAGAQGRQVAVEAELQRLMAEQGFTVTGLEQTKDTVGYVEEVALVDRLHLLLENFDHIILQRPGGGVERLIILGEKVAYQPAPMVIAGDGPPGAAGEAGAAGAAEIVIPTQRKGTSHMVSLSVEGPGGQRITETALIDTGAEHLVLPISLLSALGLGSGSLQTQRVQTANGQIEAMIGAIPAVWLGDTRVADVSVAFIDDQRLGGTALLGMSVLGRFRVTIDDAGNELRLAAK